MSNFFCLVTVLAQFCPQFMGRFFCACKSCSQNLTDWSPWAKKRCICAARCAYIRHSLDAQVERATTFRARNLGLQFAVHFYGKVHGGPIFGPSWGNLSEQSEKKRSLNVNEDLSRSHRRQVASPEAQRKGKD